MSINLVGSNLSAVTARGKKQDNTTLMSQIENAIVNANKTYGTQNTSTAKQLVNQLKTEVLNNNLTPARAANYMLALGASNVQLKTLDGGGQALIATVFGSTIQCSFAQIPGADSFSKIVPGTALSGQAESTSLITSLKNTVYNINNITNQTTKNSQIRSFISTMMSNFQQGKLSLPNIINALNTIGVSDVQVTTATNGKQQLQVTFCGSVFRAMTNGISQNIKGVTANVAVDASLSTTGEKASTILSNLSNGKITTSAAVSQLRSAGLAVSVTTSGALTNYSYSVDGKRYEIITNGTTTTSTTGTSSLANDYKVMATKIKSLTDETAKKTQTTTLIANMMKDCESKGLSIDNMKAALLVLDITTDDSEFGSLKATHFEYNGKSMSVLTNGTTVSTLTETITVAQKRILQDTDSLRKWNPTVDPFSPDLPYYPPVPGGSTSAFDATDYDDIDSAKEIAKDIISMSNATDRDIYVYDFLTKLENDLTDGKFSIDQVGEILNVLAESNSLKRTLSKESDGYSFEFNGSTRTISQNILGANKSSQYNLYYERKWCYLQNIYESQGCSQSEAITKADLILLDEIKFDYEAGVYSTSEAVHYFEYNDSDAAVNDGVITYKYGSKTFTAEPDARLTSYYKQATEIQNLSKNGRARDLVELKPLMSSIMKDFINDNISKEEMARLYSTTGIKLSAADIRGIVQDLLDMQVQGLCEAAKLGDFLEVLGVGNYTESRNVLTKTISFAYDSAAIEITSERPHYETADMDSDILISEYGKLLYEFDTWSRKEDMTKELIEDFECGRVSVDFLEVALRNFYSEITNLVEETDGRITIEYYLAGEKKTATTYNPVKTPVFYEEDRSTKGQALLQRYSSTIETIKNSDQSDFDKKLKYFEICDDLIENFEKGNINEQWAEAVLSKLGISSHIAYDAVTKLSNGHESLIFMFNGRAYNATTEYSIVKNTLDYESFDVDAGGYLERFEYNQIKQAANEIRNAKSSNNLEGLPEKINKLYDNITDLFISGHVKPYSIEAELKLCGATNVSYYTDIQGYVNLTFTKDGKKQTITTNDPLKQVAYDPAKQNNENLVNYYREEWNDIWELDAGGGQILKEEILNKVVEDFANGELSDEMVNEILDKISPSKKRLIERSITKDSNNLTKTLSISNGKYTSTTKLPVVETPPEETPGAILEDKYGSIETVFDDLGIEMSDYVKSRLRLLKYYSENPDKNTLGESSNQGLQTELKALPSATTKEELFDALYNQLMAEYPPEKYSVYINVTEEITTVEGSKPPKYNCDVKLTLKVVNTPDYANIENGDVEFANSFCEVEQISSFDNKLEQERLMNDIFESDLEFSQENLNTLIAKNLGVNVDDLGMAACTLSTLLYANILYTLGVETEEDASQFLEQIKGKSFNEVFREHGFENIYDDNTKMVARAPGKDRASAQVKKVSNLIDGISATFSFIPVFGTAVSAMLDFTNIFVSIMEGDYLNAGLSALTCVISVASLFAGPASGLISGSAKAAIKSFAITRKAVKFAVKNRQAIKYTVKGGDYAWNIYSGANNYYKFFSNPNNSSEQRQTPDARQITKEQLEEYIEKQRQDGKTIALLVYNNYTLDDFHNDLGISDIAGYLMPEIMIIKYKDIESISTSYDSDGNKIETITLNNGDEIVNKEVKKEVVDKDGNITYEIEMQPMSIIINGITVNYEFSGTGEVQKMITESIDGTQVIFNNVTKETTLQLPGDNKEYKVGDTLPSGEVVTKILSAQGYATNKTLHIGDSTYNNTAVGNGSMSDYMFEMDVRGDEGENLSGTYINVDKLEQDLLDDGEWSEEDQRKLEEAWAINSQQLHINLNFRGSNGSNGSAGSGYGSGLGGGVGNQDIDKGPKLSFGIYHCGDRYPQDKLCYKRDEYWNEGDIYVTMTFPNGSTIVKKL